MADLISLKSGKEIESLELNLLTNSRTLSKSQISRLDDTLDEGDIDELITKFDITSNYITVRWHVRNNPELQIEP